MKKLLVTMILGVGVLSFTSCEQEQVIPRNGGATEQVKIVGPQEFLDEDVSTKPIEKPSLSIVLDQEERVHRIED